MVNLLHGTINVGLIVCFFCILLSAQKIDRIIPISFLSYEDSSIVVLVTSFYLLSLNQCIWFRGGGAGLYLHKICQPMWNKPSQLDLWLIIACAFFVYVKLHMMFVIKGQSGTR